MLSTRQVSCPYCGELFEAVIDSSAGDASYIEDCYVCCRPIVFRISVTVDGDVEQVTTQSEND
ncbi:MAG: hypothetical protein CMO26_12310 [Thiotrichales bacterium]|nr:hypothetical protein [Thiotrichales bacterium]